MQLTVIQAGVGLVGELKLGLKLIRGYAAMRQLWLSYTVWCNYI